MEKVKHRQQAAKEKWITISLATFAGVNNEENSVETEILRQMVHKIGTSLAPKSGLRKLSDHKPVMDVFIAALILTFILLTVYLPKFSGKLFSFQASYLEYLAFSAWLSIAGVGLYQLVRTNVISKIVRRVKIFEAEFDVAPSDSDSPYERSADEIVYLLNASKVDAVIFEDLDRFDSLAIFERMRNLNALANDSRFSDERMKKSRGKTSKPLKFFFLVRDGLFENPHDRTKFFDFVIPVVPYVDTDSALDIFRNALNGVGITVDEGFLYQLSSYIDDPRIIHSIANEAYHYKKALFQSRSFTDSDSQRLVALLSYKAFFPRDFELLQVGRGYLHEVLNGKHRLIGKLIENHDNEQVKLREELTNITQQAKVSKDELLCIFGLPKLGSISCLANQFSDPKTFNPHTFIEKAEQDDDDRQTLEDIQESLEENEGYKQRLMEITGDENRRSNVILKRLKELATKTEIIRSMTIKQLIDELPDADTLFKFTDEYIKRKEDFEELSMASVISSPSFPMLRFLVSSGYIDESYRRYTSNFYSDTLCAEDDDFLSSIKQATSIDLSYKPKAPAEIVRRMSPEMFTRKSSRNPWLICTLLNSKDEKKIDAFMKSVRQSGGIRYLAQFIDSEQFTPKIFPLIPRYFNNPVAELLSDENISAQQKRCFCKYCLVIESANSLAETENSIFVEYINSDPLFLENDQRFNDTEIEEGLRRSGYRAKAIDFHVANTTLLKFVYDNHLFMPKASIIDGYLGLEFEVNQSMDRGTLVTEALKLSDGPIADVISENIAYFISSVVEGSKTSLKDTPKTVIDVLNNKTIQKETAEKYINLLSNIEIANISQVTSPIYKNALLAAQLVKCNAKNIISFYRAAEKSISDDLAKLIESKGLPSDMKQECDETGIDYIDIISKLIKNNAISANTKKTILASCGVTFSSFDIEILDDETIKAMIETRTIEMNTDMLNKFRKHCPRLKLDYILSAMDDFLLLITSDSSKEAETEIEEDELSGVLGSNIDTQQKLIALNCFNDVVSPAINYASEINTAIITNHFSLDDINNLYRLYEGAPEELKDQISKIFVANDETVISDGVEFGVDLLLNCLKYTKEDREKSLGLLAWYFKKHKGQINRTEVTKCFETAEMPDYVKLMHGPMSMIPESDPDDEMLYALAALGMCGTVSDNVNAEQRRKVHSRGHKRK